jgi:hypothetical protein
MASTFQQLYQDVQHTLGDASATTTIKIKRWLNDARNMLWVEIHGEFKEATDYVATAAAYTSTSVITVTVTNGSTTVTSDGSTNTAFTAAMVGRFIQLNGTDPWYKIASRTSATEIEIADAYLGSTDTACAFEVNTYLWPLPAGVQHLILVSMEDEENWTSLPILDRTDVYGDVPVPLRWDTGTAEVCWMDEKDASGNYQLGLYPAPDTASLVRVRYAEDLTEMSADSDTVGIPGGDACVKSHAKFEAFTYAGRRTEAQLWLARYMDQRERLTITAPRSRVSAHRRRDHTSAGGSRNRRVNLGSQFP